MNFRAMAEKLAEIFSSMSEDKALRERVCFICDEKADSCSKLVLGMEVGPEHSEPHILLPSLTDDEQYELISAVFGKQQAQNASANVGVARFLNDQNQARHAEDVLWLLRDYVLKGSIPFSAEIDVERQAKQFEESGFKRAIDLAECQVEINIQISGISHPFTLGEWARDGSGSTYAQLKDFFDADHLLSVWKAAG